MSDKLKEKSIHVIKWSAIDRISQQAIQFLIGLVLARILPIEAFGLIGIIFIFNSLSFILVDSGFGQSLIRNNCSSDNEFTTVFFFNLVIGVSIYLLLFLTSPLIALFFNQPEITTIARVAFLAIPLSSLYLVPWSKLSIKLDYKNSTIVNLLSVIISGIIGITFAFTGFGVWALVWQLLTFHFCRAILFNIFAKWRPMMFFSISIVSQHWKFSMNLMLTGVLDTIFNNIFTIAIGKFFSLKELSFYNQANKLSENINYSFVAIFASGTFNIFSKIHEDTQRLKRLFLEFTYRISIIVIPACFTLIAISNNLIITLIGERWAEAIPFFQLICAANIFAPLYKVNINTLNVKGLSKSTFNIELTKKILIMALALPLLYFSSKIMIAVYAVICWVIYLFSINKVNAVLSIKWHEYMQLILSPFAIGILMCIGAWSINLLGYKYYFSLILQLILCGSIYITYVRIFYKSFFNQILDYLRKNIK